jgi:guanylate kinase
MTPPIFILVGPSGSGKSTIEQHLLTNDTFAMQRAITTTTREPRTGEQNGIEYWFLNKEDFKRGIEGGDFVEWIEGFGNYYGTSKSEIKQKLKDGRPLSIVTDMPGALEIKKQFPNTKIIFLSVPKDELVERLKARKSTPETFEMRVAKIDREIESSKHADIIVDNRDGRLAKAVEEIETYIRATMAGI